jgi:hypothetical protein
MTNPERSNQSEGGVALVSSDSAHAQTEDTEFAQTVLTLGWFAKAMRLGAVGVLGVARGLGGGAIRPSVRLICCSYHMA